MLFFGVFVYTGKFRNDVNPDSVVQVDLSQSIAIPINAAFSGANEPKKHY